MSDTVGVKLAPEADPRLAGSFRNFMVKCWRSIGFIGPRELPTPLQLDIAQFLQYGGDRKEIMAFRGAAKSYITDAYCLWKLYRNPYREKVLTTSATGGFAANNAQFVWSMLQNFDWLQWLRPRSDQRQSQLEFDVNYSVPAKDCSFAAVGITGQITGRRATTIVADDVETPNTSSTDGARAELRRRIGEFSAIILPGGEIDYLGTAQTEDTVYLDQEAKGYVLRMWPCSYPRPEDLKRYGGRLSPMILKHLEENPHLAGTSLEPTRFSEVDLAQREMEWGRTEFGRQFYLFFDAGLSNKRPLKIRDLITMDIEPGGMVAARLTWNPSVANPVPGLEIDAMPGDGRAYGPVRVVDDAGNVAEPGNWLHLEHVLVWIDPSGEGSDETVWTILGLRGNRVYLLHQGKSLEGHSATVMQAIAKDCATWKVREVFVESNFGQGMFAELLQPHLRAEKCECSVEVERAGRQQKEERIIATLEPLLTAHRLVVNTAVLRDDFEIPYKDIEDAKRRQYRLTYQLTRITRERGCLGHDDRVDSLASACAKAAGWLQKSDSEVEQEAKDRALEAEIDKIIQIRRRQGLPLHGLDKDTQKLARWMRQGGREASDLMAAFKRRDLHDESDFSDFGSIRVHR